MAHPAPTLDELIDDALRIGRECTERERSRPATTDELLFEIIEGMGENAGPKATAWADWHSKR